MEERRGVDDLTAKVTRCCEVQPEKSTGGTTLEGKENEKAGEYHYSCPGCGKNPAMIKVVG